MTPPAWGQMVNGVDLGVALVLGFLALQGFEVGLVAGLLYLALAALALSAGVIGMQPAGDLLVRHVDLPVPAAYAAAFAGLTAVTLILGGMGLSSVVRGAVWLLGRVRLLRIIDQTLGVLPPLVIGGLLVSGALLFPLLVPVSPEVRQAVTASWWGKTILPQVAAFAPRAEEAVALLPQRHLTEVIAPARAPAEEGQALPIPPGVAVSVDERDEARMLDLVNGERRKAGLVPLVLDKNLREVARAHSADMFGRRYFSHVNPDGASPFDRMRARGITFGFAGENLAYAPNLDLAHNGLMNSPGHRANILRPEFRRAGIGVMASDLYGRMYSQEFAD